MIDQILRISDGTTRATFVRRRKQSGFRLVGWSPRVAAYKQGGVWRDSPFGDGRQLVDSKWENVTETFRFHLQEATLDRNAEALEALRFWLEKANSYWKTRYQNQPMWLEAKAPCETNSRYAIIHYARVEGDNNPYTRPLAARRRSTQADLVLAVERGPWSSHCPGTGACAELSAQQEWHYELDWNLNSSQPVSRCRALFGAEECDYIFAGDTGDVWRTNDPSILNNWTSHGLTPNDLDVYSFARAPNGNIYVAGYSSSGANGRTNVSTTCGAAWSEYIAGTPRGTHLGYGALCIGGDGLLYLATGDTLGTPALLSSDPNAGSPAWNIAISSSDWDIVGCILSMSAGSAVPGRMVLGVENTDGGGEIWITDDYWATYERTWIFEYWRPTFLFETSDGLLLAGTSGGAIFSSVDGRVWEQRVGGIGSSIFAIDEDDDGLLKCTTYTEYVYVSGDGGYTWETRELVNASRDHTIGVMWSSFMPAGGQWYAAVNDTALANPEVFGLDNIVTVGRAATCDDEVYISNKRGELNLTHVMVYDASGPSYTDQFPAAAFPFNLLPAPPAAGDIVYFGIDTALQAAGDPPIDNVVLDIGTPAYGISGLWEYYTAAAWTALTVHDGTDAGGGAFTRSGVCSVHFVPPDDAQAVDVNGTTALWLRYRVTSIGTPTPPTQQNRDVYSCVKPRIDIAAAQVPGTLPALARLTLRMRSDEDGLSGDGPDLYANRVVVGLRSVERGPDFTAYLNLADEQNPPGVDISLGASTSFVNYMGAAPGRAGLYAPTGVQEMAMRGRVELSNQLARQYHGAYRAFLRCSQVYGASGDIRVRLFIGTPWGSDNCWSDVESIPETLSYNKLIDFGRIELPLSQLLSSEAIATTRVEIHAECTTSGAGALMAPLSAWVSNRILAPYDTATQAGVNPTDFEHWTSKQLWYDGLTLSGDFPRLYMLELIVIPADEYLGDFIDGALSETTALQQGRVFQIDSIGNPKAVLRGIVREAATNAISATYVPLPPGPAILQPQVDQRLWFLFDKSNSLETPDWDASPHIGLTVQGERVSRYLGMRGSK